MDKQSTISVSYITVFEFLEPVYVNYAKADPSCYSDTFWYLKRIYSFIN